jgi:predicted negative regulator of RcsB-dependent stress response
MKFLLVIGVIVILGALMVGFRMYRDRTATSMEETMRQFQRGLDALDPSNDPLTRTETRSSLRRDSHGSNRQQNPASGRDNGPTQER